jgi:hypothetical protein
MKQIQVVKGNNSGKEKHKDLHQLKSSLKKSDPRSKILSKVDIKKWKKYISNMQESEKLRRKSP